MRWLIISRLLFKSTPRTLLLFLIDYCGTMIIIFASYAELMEVFSGYMNYQHLVEVLDYNFPLFVTFKIAYEFDFTREANAMEKIRRFLYENNKKTPVLVPRVVRDFVTRFVLLFLFYIKVRICKCQLC